MEPITVKNIELFSQEFNSKKENIISKNAISNNKLLDIIKERDIIQQRNNVFSKHIDIEVKNTNQKNSGRCWIFAFLNLLRLDMIKKYKLEDTFEFSQNYLFFWDKLEKSNFFIYNIINTKKYSVESREVKHLLSEPVSDGGQWNMLTNLVNKYGVIPKTLMNETFGSCNSEELSFVLNNKLRSIAFDIRNRRVTKKDINEYLGDIYKILVLFLGEPPKKITWEYYSLKDEKKKYHIMKDISPKIFYEKYVPYNINDMVCLVNAPCKSKPFYNLFNLKNCGNVIEGVNTNFINIPINEMLRIAKKSLDNKKAIWFGSDVDKYLDNKIGILDSNFLNYNSIFGDFIKIDKGDRLDYCTSSVSHAMILKGYDSINNKIIKWLVENSWGDDNELEGDLIMSNDWFKDYVFEIVVNKKFVSKKILNVLDKKPIELDPWDPLGLLLKPLKKTEKKNFKKNKKTKKNLIY
jgi:bleomycin hydrolase